MTPLWVKLFWWIRVLRLVNSRAGDLFHARVMECYVSWFLGIVLCFLGGMFYLTRSDVGACITLCTGGLCLIVIGLIGFVRAVRFEIKSGL